MYIPIIQDVYLRRAPLEGTKRVFATHEFYFKVVCFWNDVARYMSVQIVS